MNGLQAHMKREHNETTSSSDIFACHMCTKMFSTDARRAQHEQDKHSTDATVENLRLLPTDVLTSNTEQSNDEIPTSVDLIQFDTEDHYALPRSTSPSKDSQAQVQIAPGTTPSKLMSTSLLEE